jgi:hypothetical protein
MFLAATKSFSVVLFFLTPFAFAQPVCPVDQIVVRGRIDHPPSNAKVRVQLVYAKNMPGESGDITPETERFSLPVDFLTRSREPIVNNAATVAMLMTELSVRTAIAVENRR